MNKTSETEEILKINKLFYQALGTRDMNLMSLVWKKDQKVGCIHPGWTVIRGWEAIIQNWESIFDPSDQVNITISDVDIEVRENLAWLTCIQIMEYIKRKPVSYNISQSTNIFEKTPEGWLMILHHASPIPYYISDPTNSNTTTIQ